MLEKRGRSTKRKAGDGEVGKIIMMEEGQGRVEDERKAERRTKGRKVVKKSAAVTEELLYE